MTETKEVPEKKTDHTQETSPKQCSKTNTGSSRAEDKQMKNEIANMLFFYLFPLVVIIDNTPEKKLSDILPTVG